MPPFTLVRAHLQGSHRDLLPLLLLGSISLAFYCLTLHWGLPSGDAPGMIRPWGVDEIAPLGPLAEIHNLFTRSSLGNPQYPMGHYFLLAVFYLPYLGVLYITGGFSSPSAAFPFGFADPVITLRVLTLIARGVSALAGAATVLAAYSFSRALWDRATATVAAVLVAFSYPIAFYSRLSNVDMPAMFWTACFFVLLAHGLRDGFPLRRLMLFGAFAAAAVATKDQSIAILFPFVPLILALRLCASPSCRSKSRSFAELLAAAVCSLVLYLVLSGLVFWPEKFRHHLHFIRYGSMEGRWYFRYDLSLAGLGELFREVGSFLVESTGWTILVAALVGFVLSCRRSGVHIVFLAPFFSLLFIVILPVRYVALRFLIPIVFLQACFAAYALVRGLRSPRTWVRGIAVLTLAVSSALLMARDLDVVYLMWRDPRHPASAWLRQHLPRDATVEVFMSPSAHPAANWFPRPPPGVSLKTVVGLPREKWLITKDPEDLVYHFYAPPRVYDDLLRGRLGYELRACFQTPSFFSHPSLQLQLNPRFCVFERTVDPGAPRE